MTKETPDDLEAVRNIVASLQPFEKTDQERILRWAREKLGLVTPAVVGASDKSSSTDSESHRADSSTAGRQTDIKTFIELKKPQSDIQFAASVAYYYRFEASEPQRKASITPADLQEACRQTARSRFRTPAQTLLNAHNQGYLDKGGERGTYVINTVGENLVAMALPEGAGTNRVRNVTGRKTRV
jgi:hypothetical protein